VEDPIVIPWFRKTFDASDDKKSIIKKYVKKWLHEFEACRQENFIISAETLVYPYFPESAVRRLKEFSEQYFEEFTILAYIRHYDSWIASEVQQLIKNGTSTWKSVKKVVDRFLDCPPQLSYHQILDKWINIFGRDRIVVQPFDPQVFYKGSLLADFLHSCDLPADEISIPEIRANESIGKHAVAFLQAYNQVYPIFKNGSVNRDRGLARQGIPVDLYNNLTDEKFKLKMIYTMEQAKRFNEEIEFVNQLFTDGYQFERVTPGTGDMNFLSGADIPIEFFVELINNYNKKIEALQRKKRFFGTPIYTRVLDKLPYLKKVLQKILDL